MDYNSLCVLLFCDLGTANTMGKMFIISGESGVTPRSQDDEGYSE